jgi:hypothetical protein
MKSGVNATEESVISQQHVAASDRQRCDDRLDIMNRPNDFPDFQKSEMTTQSSILFFNSETMKFLI